MAHATEWMNEALCTTELYPDAWFPDSSSEDTHPYLRAAKHLCLGCPVQAECAEAGTTEGFGVWGGVLIQPRNAVRYDPIAPRRTSAIGSTRRLRALVALGYHPRDVLANIKRYTGYHVPPADAMSLLAGETNSTSLEVAEHVGRAYKRMQNGLNCGHRANEMFKMAEQNDWATPRRWRGIDIDDRESEPMA